jgi:hypothetical protein
MTESPMAVTRPATKPGPGGGNVLVVVVGGSVVVVVAADPSLPCGESVGAFPQCWDKRSMLHALSTARTTRSVTIRGRSGVRRRSGSSSCAIEPVSRPLVLEAGQPLLRERPVRRPETHGDGLARRSEEDAVFGPEESGSL